MVTSFLDPYYCFRTILIVVIFRVCVYDKVLSSHDIRVFLKKPGAIYMYIDSAQCKMNVESMIH